LKSGLINISTVTINNNDNGINFLKSWVKHVVSTPMKNKNGIKWGQYAIALAFNECRENTEFFRFERGTFSPYLLETAPVWIFKTKFKDNDMKIARNELNALRKK
jgi:hypothetical protein